MSPQPADTGQSQSGAPPQERVVVALSGAVDTDRLIRRAGDLALRSGGELIGVHVVATDQRARGDSSALEDRRRLLESLGGTYHEIVGSDIARALTDFAASQNATQIVLGATRRSRWSEALRGSVAH